MGEISPAIYRAGSGEPLLLLHGFLGSWPHWRPLLGELAARYEVIAPTLAGHDGGPPYPPSAPLTLAAATDDFEGRLDELGVDTAHIVGNSMGGALALELAKRGRARSVVALAPAGGWTDGDGEARRLANLFSRQLRLTRLIESRLSTVMARPSARRTGFREVMRHGELVAPADAVDMALASLRCTLADRAIAMLRSDRGFTVQDLDRISCPVLLATPRFDRILPPPKHAPRFRREIPGAEWCILPGCGHVPMWDDTRLVVRTIHEFVSRHTTASRPLTAPDAALSHVNI